MTIVIAITTNVLTIVTTSGVAMTDKIIHNIILQACIG
jgi:hypothetical protein